MRILVTGGAGFIGSHFVRSLLGGAYPAFGEAEVTVYDKLTYAGNLANLAPVEGDPRYRFVHGDILDTSLLDEVLPGHDLVLNFAAESHVDRSIAGAADFVMTNTVGVQTLLDACLRAGVSRVLQVSTDEVYGSTDGAGFVETDLLEPSSPYSAAKAGGDLIARAYFVTHKVNVSITRCTNNYGPFQFPEKVIPLFVTNLIDGKTVPLYGDGLNVRDWLHVDDHCRGIQLVLEGGRPGEVYNIGGGVELTNKELTQRLLDEGIDPSVGSVGDAYDNALAETTVGSFKNELIRRQGPWRDVNHIEAETLHWVDWFNTERPHEYLDDLTPAQAEKFHYDLRALAAAG